MCSGAVVRQRRSSRVAVSAVGKRLRRGRGLLCVCGTCTGVRAHKLGVAGWRTVHAATLSAGLETRCLHARPTTTPWRQHAVWKGDNDVPRSTPSQVVLVHSMCFVCDALMRVMELEARLPASLALCTNKRPGLLWKFGGVNNDA